MPSFQVGAACYPTQIQAAQIVASSQIGGIVQQGGSAHVVELRSINPTSITYGLRPVSGGPLIEVVSTFDAQPCGLLQASDRSEEHTSELQSHLNLVCRLLLEKKKPAASPIAAAALR